MSTPAASASPRARSLARSVTATWWYTASSVIFIQGATLVLWFFAVVLNERFWSAAVGVAVYLTGAALSFGSAIALLLAYRRASSGDESERPWPPTPLVWVGLGTGAAATVVLGVATGSLLVAASSAVFIVSLLHLPPGVRVRFLLLATLALIAVWLVERVPDGSRLETLVFPAFAIMLPATAVLSMWWWDVVVELDRARAGESRLAAAQERLNLASDLHDLQGHHLQVIALQLELAERMLPRDPSAALEQVRLARASVDDARRGTRELAGRFRGVPLPDELANAADLLRAAGIRVELRVAPEAIDAPADVLGPVVRECTTNVLKHGGGSWAHLALARTGGDWVLRVANDARDQPSVLGTGSGLAGIGERVRTVGGDIHTAADGDEFEVVVTVPAAEEPR